MESTKDWLDLLGRIAIRGRRPAVGWIGVLFLAMIGAAIALAYWRAAMTGAVIPDMTGGIGPIAIALGPVIIDQITRHMEVKSARAGSESGLGMGPGAAAGAS